MQSFVDRDLLSGAAAVILKNNMVVDYHNCGFADIESKRPVTEDTIYRIYSNTKIITSVAALCLLEDGKFSLDDPLSKFLPELSNLAVLKEGSDDPSETEPLQTEATIRQLMSHQAGFSYGIFAESPVDALYLKHNVLGTDGTLAEMVTKLSALPLANQPGTRFQYSVSTDVLARLVEIWSGQSFIAFLQDRIFRPLAMVDTDFVVPEGKQHRLATNYVPVDPMDPMKPGLNAEPDSILGSFQQPKALASGGGGLVSTISDYTNFMQMLIGSGEYNNVRILKDETMALMQSNQLPAGKMVQLPNWHMPNTVFGLGLAIKTAPMPGEPDQATGEVHWGGLAGTHTWISPSGGIAALIFTQRLPGFWHEFSHEFKRQVYQAAV